MSLLNLKIQCKKDSLISLEVLKTGKVWFKQMLKIHLEQAVPRKNFKMNCRVLRTTPQLEKELKRIHYVVVQLHGQRNFQVRWRVSLSHLSA